MMRPTVFFACALLLTASMGTAGPPESKATGLGFILGEPTGLMLKSWLSRTTAFDVAAAWSFEDEGAFYVHADYLAHSFGLIETKKGRIPLHYGIGGWAKVDHKTRAGFRIPVGLSYLFDKIPLDIFVEVGGMLEVVPKTDFWANAFVGVRYYF
ncbi:MAG: hypothetical protein PHX45_02600 [Acidobacteriota bacterium]|nr:hypothetical protein [Acidobacteriota bacterium]